MLLWLLKLVIQFHSNFALRILMLLHACMAEGCTGNKGRYRSGTFTFLLVRESTCIYIIQEVKCIIFVRRDDCVMCRQPMVTS